MGVCHTWIVLRIVQAPVARTMFFHWFISFPDNRAARNTIIQGTEYLTVWSWYHNIIKFLNFQMPENFAVIYLKLKLRGKILRGILSKRCKLNSKQWRPLSDCSFRSSLIWVCTVPQDLSVGKLRITMVYYTFISNLNCVLGMRKPMLMLWYNVI